MTRFKLRLGFSLLAGGAVLGSVLLNGCSGGTNSIAVGGAAAEATQGMVHGGQQPVSGATIQIYAAGTTGDGSAATPLLGTVVKTDPSGGFTVPTFTCPNSSAQVYLVATGGNPGLAAGTNNSALVMMTALGSCGSLSSAKFIFVNEATTVAGVWALAPYMSSYSGVGSGTADAAALAGAFTLADELANSSTGAVPGVNVPAGVTVPVDQINTLADILAACVNTSGGIAGDGSACGKLLFAATPTGGAAPVNVMSAALNIADDPTANIASLFALVVPSAPFQPALTAAPSNYAVQVSTPTGLTVSPVSLAFPAEFLATPSAAKTVTLTNSSTGAIALSSVQVIGDDAGDFSRTGGSCSTSLAGGASCTVQISFTASAVGARSGYLSIVNNSAVSPVQVALSGAGMANSIGPVSLSPSSVTFPARNLGTTSPLQLITLMNTGNETLTISNISIAGSNIGDFAIASDNCGSTVAASGSCVIGVTFTPTAAGARSAMLQVLSNAVNAPNTALLLGTGN